VALLVGALAMNRIFLAAVAALAVGFSITLVTYAGAQNCTLPPGSGESVVWAWGANENGELGDGTTTTRLVPVQVQNLSGIQTIAAGGGHSLALKNDCTVWAWGDNSNGQLGNGTAVDANLPVQVHNLTGITAIAAGFFHSLALRNDGTVWAWGWNSFGQLGDGTFMDRNEPAQVQNLSGVIGIAAGGDHCLALRGDGSVWAWGENFFGELGDGTTVHRNTPVQVQNLSGVTAVAIGSSHSLALKGDSTVRAWGQNNVGELGDGTTIDRHTPVQVFATPLVNVPDAAGRLIIPPPGSLSGVTRIAAGIAFSLALKNDGRVWAWGSNISGSLGDDTNIDRHTAVGPVGHVSGVTAIAAGGGQSLAVRSNAIVQAWGEGLFGQLGDNSTINSPFAVQVENLVENLSTVVAVSAGTTFSLAAGVPLTQLTVTKFVMHPNPNHLRVFNLKVDGTVVLPNTSGGSNTSFVSPGNHTVSETGGAQTLLTDFTTVIGGACAADGTVNLALGDKKTCTITNFDPTGGCASGSICCVPGEGMQPCSVCAQQGHECK